MRNKRVAIVLVSVLVVVLMAVFIMEGIPALMDAIRSVHFIPQH